MVSLPLYRAKKFDSDEWVEGYYDGGAKIITSLVGSTTSKHDGTIHNYRASLIYKDTLAIHFPNMIDKNGKKIFASLSEDGVGGDECINPKWEGKDNKYNLMVARLVDTIFALMFICDKDISLLNFRDIEVIGIHKGE